ncbi:fumarylacetoacetate hydrolase family protein [Pelomonas sp. V22]|uniref:fumarylacetoacetate hydrolase family protein n=1 Tax=Pelomonas sp. V22 TaxID=2822139 RepID=UPI0024A9FB5D|nr:fumarylacetoacetate hydrolase family protein [Pelomonas sp. V22]MDI4635558.1 fumarylacetoacetate hydrolase family protein [Pelomonas sp. V22]
MSDYVFPPPPQPSVAVRGTSARYAVSRIFCVGRNYAAHAREMGSDPDREPPFFFCKPASALAESGSTIPYPPGTTNYHYEMELVIALGAPVFKATPEQAAASIWGYAAGLDMTRRDLQNAAKATGRPWDFGKAFEQSAVITELVPAAEIGHPVAGAITLAVNGEEQQRGDLSDMIWRTAEVVANLSQYYHLGPGDLIYTGTPEGVGPVQPGDRLEGRIEGVARLALTIGAPE